MAFTLPKLTAAQQALVDAPLERKLWLDGIAGSGKTSCGIARLLRLLEQGVPAESILLFVPQRSLAQPYREALRAHPAYSGGQLAVHTIGSLARDLVETFWFLIAERAGFAHPHDLPNFLSLEMVQYFMTRAIESLVAQRDYFKSVRIDRARLYSQIIDNMNKAAMVGFPISEIGTRLQSALGGGVEQAHIYADAQACALAFREYCLQRNLLDFSLLIELFNQQALALPVPRENLRGRFQHLIADNVEEDNPTAHRFLMSLLPSCQSALVICDHDAGVRRFLGADPESAERLRQACHSQVTLNDSFVMSEAIAALGAHLSASLLGEEVAAETDFRPALMTTAHRYHPQMIKWVVDEISKLVFEKGVKPQDIAVLAPFMTDSLRFSLFESLRRRGLSARSHRPSRALRDEPAARTLLTLARLAHPGWGAAPAQFDMAFALTHAIAGLDLVRAKLLCDVLYRDGGLHPFSDITNAAMQDRITFAIGKRYDQLRGWIATYSEGEPIAALDIFFRRLYSEVLARRGFGFHADVNASNISRNLVDSARGFRWSLEFLRAYDGDIDLARDYVQMVERGLIANFYLRDWIEEAADSVYIAPAYTFLLSNRAVDVQFWLNISSESWSSRLFQPLTHPYVLSRGWQAGAAWSESDEQELERQTLCRLALALTRRCRQAVYLGYSELGESGYEARGLLLETLHTAFRRVKAGAGDGAA
ncbi:MAG: ATP-dependent helicase [Chloroflexi bacterium]|nr:ATP-dependent helicase [Chloroflexota bacterium]